MLPVLNETDSETQASTGIALPQDAFVSIQSSDGLAYKVHKLILTMQCPGLPPPDCPMTPDGTFLLPESGSILKKLFYYLYPHLCPKPSPSDLSFDEILDIHRAVERYKVAVAQEFWFKVLWDRSVQAPVAALAYAAEVQNQELFNHAAPLAVQSNVSLPDMLSALPQRLWVQWFCYHSRWNQTFRRAINSIPMRRYNTSPNPDEWSHCNDCGLSHCSSCFLTSSQKLLWKLGSDGSFTNLKIADDYLEQTKGNACDKCSIASVSSQLQTWRTDLQQSIQAIPLPDLALHSPNNGVGVASTQMSNLFSFSDADIIIRSVDGVEFHLHKKNLEVCCGAFPPSSHPTMGEVVHLTELGSTLETLFQFIYARQQPKWEGLKFSELYNLAEAAEKYEVYTAMRVCNMLMQRFIQSNPASVFAYAIKHGYDDLADATTPLFNASDAKVVCDLAPRLTPNAVMAPDTSSTFVFYVTRHIYLTRPLCNATIRLPLLILVILLIEWDLSQLWF
ncbi:hypothetical protein AX16_005316 [Volvariella volvacea WC 439]|nr:hypothetical protein AX16_005316 [Volvariella volvacea WC 439]